MFWALNDQLFINCIFLLNWMFYYVILGRYLFCCSYTHNVAPKGKFIAFVSSEAETDQPAIELKPGIDLLGPVDEIFFDIYDRYEPVNEPTLDNCFISMVSVLSLEDICAVCCWYRLTGTYLKLVYRVMMLLLTLSRLWMTFSTCIHW